MDLSISFRGNTIVPESAIRPSFPRISLFVDPSITAIQKPILKKFPDVELGKVGRLRCFHANVSFSSRNLYFNLTQILSCAS